MRRYWVLVATLLLQGLLHAPMLFGGRLYAGRYVPLFHYFFFEIQKTLVYSLHQVPDWWPHFYSGYPVSQTLNGFLNPLFIVALGILPTIEAYHWVTFGLMVITQLAAYAAAREMGMSKPASFLAGASYSLGGILARWTDVIVFTALFPVLPLLVLSGKRVLAGRSEWMWAIAALTFWSWVAGFSELLIYYVLGCGVFFVPTLWLLRTNGYPMAWQVLIRRIARIFIGLILGTLVILPWLVPMYRTIQVSHRAMGLDVDSASSMPLTASHLIHAFLPRLSIPYAENLPYIPLGDDLDLFVGSVGLLLLMLIPFLWKQIRIRDKWSLLALTGFGVLMGFRSPLFLLLHRLPVLSWFRWHFKWTFLTIFGLAMFIGLAFDAIRNLDKIQRAKLRRWAWYLLGAIVVAGLGLLVATIAAPWLTLKLSTIAQTKLSGAASGVGRALPRSSEYYAFIVSLMVGGFVKTFSFRDTQTTIAFISWLATGGWLVWFLRTKQIERAWLAGLALGVVTIALPWISFFPGASRDYLTQQPQSATIICKQTGCPRVPIFDSTQAAGLSRIFTYAPYQFQAELQDRYRVNLRDEKSAANLSRDLLQNNISGWFGVEALFDNEPLLAKRMHVMREAVLGAAYQKVVNDPLSKDVERFSATTTARLLGFFNVRHVLSPLELGGVWKRVDGFVQADTNIPINIYEAPRVQPRWYLADHVAWIAQPEAESFLSAFHLIEDRKGLLTVIEAPTSSAARGVITSVSSTDAIHLEKYSAGEWRGSIKASGWRWFVFQEAANPFWMASIDGVATDIYQANLGFQAILIPPGEHRVEFRFQEYGERFKQATLDLITQ